MTETRGDDLLRSPTDTLRAAALRLRMDVFNERRESERERRKAASWGNALVPDQFEISPPQDYEQRRWAIDLALAEWLERWVNLSMLADTFGPYGEPDLQHALTVAKAVLGTS